MPLQAEPRSNRYMMVGTAFDYLLRFELQRRAPHAVVNPWIAELALERLCPGVGKAVLDVFAPDFDLYMPPEEVGRRSQAIVDNAKTFVGTFLKTTSPTSRQLTNLAGHAIRLAKLDDAYRAMRLDPHFEEAASLSVIQLCLRQHNRRLVCIPEIHHVLFVLCFSEVHGSQTVMQLEGI